MRGRRKVLELLYFIIGTDLEVGVVETDLQLGLMNYLLILLDEVTQSFGFWNGKGEAFPVRRAILPVNTITNGNVIITRVSVEMILHRYEEDLLHSDGFGVSIEEDVLD